MKSKLLFMLFMSFILLSHAPLEASNFSNITHQEIINTNIDQLTLIQNQIFALAQKILFSSIAGDSSSKNDTARINSSIDEVSKSLYNYASKLSDDSSEKRDTFLLINAANYIKSSLYELNSLAAQDSPPEKITTLERYFNYRVYATNTIKLVANLLSRE